MDFSKKIENHVHAVALHMMFYNFGRIHKTFADYADNGGRHCDYVWSLDEIAALER